MASAHIKISILISFLLISFSIYSQTFTEQTGISLTGVRQAAVAWGDYDNDNDLDILLTGFNASSIRVSQVYRNNGNNTFSLQSGIVLQGIGPGSVCWGDYDNDTYLDIFLVGSGNTMVYRNNGDNTFSRDYGVGFPGISNGSIDCGDYDNDGDLDVLLSGSHHSAVYKNNGDKTFTEQTGIELADLNYSNVAWGDYDSDGDLDILIGGIDIDNNRIALIYQNNGDNSFTKRDDILLAEATGKVDWGDYNNDGHLDIVLSGTGYARVYRNNGAGNFVEQTTIESDSKYGLMWGDKDHDGDLDILLTGNYQSGIYENNGDNTFTEMTGLSLPGGFKAASSWGDYDMDGDLDILLTGEVGGVPVTKIYRNDHDVSNTAPSIPGELNTLVNGNIATLQWERSTDNETPQNGLSYSLRVVSGMGSELVSPFSDIITGERKVVESGKIRTNTWDMKIKRAGSYHWYVQSIDHNFKGSGYSDEGSFLVSFTNSISPVSDQTLLPGQDGTMLTVSESLPAESRQWMYSKYPGGPYTHVISGETGASYTPNATVFGFYYVVCVSSRSGVSVISNEVKVEIPQFTHLSNLAGVSNSSVAWGDYDNDGDLDILLTGSDLSRIYRNNGNSTFTEQTGIVLTGVSDGSVDWGDYDNDGDLDILLTGENTIEGMISKIYLNNGNSTFTEQSTQLAGVVSGAAKWADYDSDGDLDILLSGRSSVSSQVFKLYRNEGFYQFTDIAVNIPPFSDGDMSLADYDEDGDLDILLAGWDYSGNIVTKIYRNDGAEKFRNARAGLTGAFESAVDWGDYDNDGDLDILLSGNDGEASSARITTIYKNDGDGGFSELTGTNFKELGSGTADWGDYDNDGDLDILLSGYNSEIKSVTVIYKNNGDHSFTEESDINLIDLNRGAADWGDYDNDGDLDILLTGNSISRIYRNNSIIKNTSPSVPSNLKARAFAKGAILTWEKSTDAQTPSNGLTYNVVVSKAPGDLDVLSPHAELDDGYRLLTDIGNASQKAGKWISNIDTGLYYWGVQAIDHAFEGSKFSGFSSFVVLPEFTDIEAALPGVRTSSCVWGDYDNDGDLDFLLSGATGYYPNYNPVTKIYNNKDNVFSEIPVILPNVSNSAAAWGDYDNDGDLDFVITGLNESSERISKIYKNNGANSFAEDGSISLEDVDEGAVAWGDYNNDGNLDLLLIGRSDGGSVSYIYKNNGDGSFKEAGNIALPGVSRGDISWGDYNNDGYLDIILTGNSSTGKISGIYKNMGDGSFEEQTNIKLTKVFDSSVAWGDYDNDGYLDLILTGESQTGNISEIHRNIGDGNFEEQTDIFIRGISGSSVMWGDYDNDGDLDILFAGSSGTHITEIYKNMGENGFVELDIGVSGASSGSTGFGDYDDDGDLDILVSGWNSEDNFFSKVYRNNIDRDLINPGVPVNLQSEESGLGIILNWEMSASDETLPQHPYTFNLRVGSTPGGIDIVSPMSNQISGKLFIPKMGNCNLNSSCQLDSLPQGDYYWSVQAIDQSYEGGNWAAEEMFSISLLNAGFESDTVCEGQPTSFNDQTLNSGSEIKTWDWDFGDGNISEDKDATHTYEEAGTYYVTLIVNSDESVDSVTQEVVVKGKPKVNFVSDVACHGNYTNFQNTTQPNGTVINSWYWEFGDGASSELEEPLTHGFLNIGEYNTKLMATSDDGCVDSIRKIVRVADYPEAGISIAGEDELCGGDSTKLSVAYNSDYAYMWRKGKNKIAGADSCVFYVTKTGRYTVSVINLLGGCITHSIDTIDVIVKDSPPDPVLITSGYSSADCPQENIITLSVDQPSLMYTYQWYRNGALMDGETKNELSGFLDEGDYSVSVSNGICENESESVDIYFDRELPPKPGIEVQGPNIWYLACTNDEADAYEWYYNNKLIEGATDYLYVADQNLGTYVVRIAEGNGCMVSSDAVTIPQTTGIKEADIWENLKIYPNPTPGLFTLEMDNHLMGELIIDIFGESGSKIINIKFHKETAHFKTRIDLSEQPAGAYLIGLMLDRYGTNRTLIVE